MRPVVARFLLLSFGGLSKKDRICTLDLDVMRTDHSPNYTPRRRFLTEAEYKKLLAVVAPKRRSTVAFMVLAAPRNSEWQSVEIKDVDFTSLLRLRGTKTKNAWRHLPLRDHKKLSALLKDVIAGLPEGETFLFERWTNIRRDLISACKKVGIDPVTPNDLRRTFGTWCYRGGMQPARIALLLGHRDASMAERVYGVMDAESLAGDVAGVFNNMDLPTVEVPKASSCPPRKWDKPDVSGGGYGAHVTNRAVAPQSRKPHRAPNLGILRGLRG